MRIPAVAISVLCVAVGFFAGTSFGASQAKSKVTNLLQAPLSASFTPGREVLVDLVEIPPDSQLDRHWHPGEEFHYYLQGDPEVTVDGKGLVRPALGTVGHVPFEARHRAGAGKAGAKILVFRVHTTGEPWRYLESERHDDHDAVRSATGSVADAADEDVRAATTRFLTAFENLDWPAFHAAWSESPSAFFPFADIPERATGRAEVEGRFLTLFEEARARMSGPPYFTFTPEQLHVQDFGDTALVTFVVRKEDRVSRRTLLFVRQRGEWKLAHLHASDLEPDGG